MFFVYATWSWHSFHFAYLCLNHFLLFLCFFFRLNSLYQIFNVNFILIPFCHFLWLFITCFFFPFLPSDFVCFFYILFFSYIIFLFFYSSSFFGSFLLATFGCIISFFPLLTYLLPKWQILLIFNYMLIDLFIVH